MKQNPIKSKPKHPKIRTAWATYRYVDHKPSRQNFLKDFRQLLKSKYTEHTDPSGHTLYTSGQQHDPRNPHWKPWRYLEKFCIKRGLDDFAVRDYLEELWGRKLVCECEIIEDPWEQAQRDIMRVFGTDFEGMEIVG